MISTFSARGGCASGANIQHSPPEADAPRAQTFKKLAIEVASGFLPVFLFLYPFLLLLDDVEPGIVRSVFNPHWILLAIVGMGTLSARTDRADRHLSTRAITVVAVSGAVIGGFWVWWKLHAGLLGVVVAVFAAVAIAAVVVVMSTETKEREIGI